MNDIFDIEEITQETDSFKIETAAQAERAVRKILESEKRLAIFDESADAEIAEFNAEIALLKARKEEKRKQTDENNAWIKQQLMKWAETVPLKKAKTQASIELASGRLIVKYGYQKLEPIDNKVIEHYEASGDYIKIKKELDWAGLKKDIVNNDGTIINTKTGEIISDDLIKVIDIPPEIEVK